MVFLFRLNFNIFFIGYLLGFACFDFCDILRSRKFEKIHMYVFVDVLHSPPNAAAAAAAVGLVSSYMGVLCVSLRGRRCSRRWWHHLFESLGRQWCDELSPDQGAQTKEYAPQPLIERESFCGEGHFAVLHDYDLRERGGERERGEESI